MILPYYIRTSREKELAGQEGLEPPTSGFGDRRSSIGATALRHHPGPKSRPRTNNPTRLPGAGGWLLGLLVTCMCAAPAAVFLDLNPIRIVLFVLHGPVVAPLAFLTRQRDLDPHVRSLSP